MRDDLGCRCVLGAARDQRRPDLSAVVAREHNFIACQLPIGLRRVVANAAVDEPRRDATCGEPLEP
jgi:hypothetical protein